MGEGGREGGVVGAACVREGWRAGKRAEASVMRGNSLVQWIW